MVSIHFTINMILFALDRFEDDLNVFGGALGQKDDPKSVKSKQHPVGGKMNRHHPVVGGKCGVLG